jgi:bifunctional non-homologous end joining protein LigD
MRFPSCPDATVGVTVNERARWRTKPRSATRRVEQPDNLSTYRAKRSPDSSPEPVGSVSPVPGRLFVVHKHAATRLHWDLRIEMEGVLRSWAVPKGPSYDMNDKRLAVRVEDHPLEYGDFEGIIPSGNYGAGGIIVWDRGEWVPLEDWREGLEKGKLLFELNGYKLHGKWTLVKIKKSERDWLLIKERDAYVRVPGDVFPEESVLSGLTVEEVKTGQTHASRIRKALEAEGISRGRIDPTTMHAMLAEPADDAFTKDGWLFELKLDGYRLLACKSRGEALLLTRNGNDYTEVFPEVAKAMKALPVDSCIIDGEVVVLDKAGKPSFALLQQRGSISSPVDVKRAAVELPAAFFVFDMLSFEDFDVRGLPLARRKQLLTEMIPKLGAVRYLDHIEREGDAFLAQVARLGLEGIIAKKADAPYRGGRSPQWLKIKAERTDDFVIVGFTEPRGNRTGLGALQLADYVDGRLVYAGRAGTGFNETQLAELRGMLDDLVRRDAPCYGPVVSPGAPPLASEQIPETRTTTWTEPIYVCEVRFREWTPDGVLRHPAFLRLRSDKRPHECERQGWLTAPQPAPAPGAAPNVSGDGPSPPDAEAATREETAAGVAPEAAPKPVVSRTVNISNPHKIFWPAEKYTKGDLIEYYKAVSKWILPYLRNRPLVLTRFPDGIDGKSFYQKDAPEFAPEWIRTEPIWSNDTQRDIKYFVCDDEESLVYIANLGAIPLHIWASRVGSLEQPDWCVIDLDPKEAPFSDVIKTAQALHRICEASGLPNYVKTTGKTGLHIMVPLGRQLTYAQSRTLGELLARLVIRELGTIVTITRNVTKRGDKVYIDYLQNRHGQLIVAPFIVRPLPGAPVSMPITWDEVNGSLDPRDFTIRTALERMDRVGADPMLPVLGESPDLEKVLGKLAGLMSSNG